MIRNGMYGQKGIAAWLLVLFLFILAEKANHDHPGLKSKDLQGETRVQTAGICPVCDFQLHEGADLPEASPVAIILTPFPVHETPGTAFFSARPSTGHPKRGPPACLA